MNLLSIWDKFFDPWRLKVLESSEQVMRYVESCLVIKSVICDWVNFTSHKLELCANFLCCLASIFNFETWEPELELIAKSEVPLEGVVVQWESGKEQELSCTPVVFKPLLSHLLGKIGFIFVEFFLRVNILKESCLRPPAIKLISFKFYG